MLWLLGRSVDEGREVEKGQRDEDITSLLLNSPSLSPTHGGARISGMMTLAEGRRIPIEKNLRLSLGQAQA